MPPRSLLFVAFLFFLVVSATAHGGHGDDDSDFGKSEKPDLRSRPLILVKIWCLIIVFVGTFAGGISPYFLKWNEGFLVLATQFAKTPGREFFLRVSYLQIYNEEEESIGSHSNKTQLSIKSCGSTSPGRAGGGGSD